MCVYKALYCPSCNKQHVDENEFSTRLHHTHRCVDDICGMGCGFEWKEKRYIFGVKLQWIVYLLQCSDNSIYCGITNNLNKRIQTHNAGKGSKYTRTRLPVKLLKSFDVQDKSSALKMEYKIKQMSREEKIKLCTD